MQPVPDQWLEVMVSGGFKVWHIIFIIIALIVTIVVVYCCFHRCRIPRTKQEIEADLMRSNMTSKFRDYLQELPNEPVTFIEVLKRVTDLEEKLEKDDALPSRDNAGMRKRMGWLKLKGKNTPPQNVNDLEAGQPTKPTTPEEPVETPVATTSLSDTNKEQSASVSIADQIKSIGVNNIKETAKSDPATITTATESTTTTKKQKIPTSKTSLDVEAATRLAKEQQHRAKHSGDSRKKRSQPNADDSKTTTTTTPIAIANGKNPTVHSNLSSNISPTMNPDDKHLARKRKHNKPNLARSKVVREKTHPSFDNGISNGHSEDKLNNQTTTINIPSPNLPLVHEQTQVTFEDSTQFHHHDQNTTSNQMSSTKKTSKKKGTSKKKLISSPKSTVSPKVKKISKTNSTTNERKDL